LAYDEDHKDVGGEIAGKGAAGEMVSGNGSHTFRCFKMGSTTSASSMSAMMRRVAHVRFWPLADHHIGDFLEY
jgi:hypothetical protein